MVILDCRPKRLIAWSACCAGTLNSITAQLTLKSPGLVSLDLMRAVVYKEARIVKLCTVGWIQVVGCDMRRKILLVVRLYHRGICYLLNT